MNLKKVMLVPACAALMLLSACGDKREAPAQEANAVSSTSAAASPNTSAAPASANSADQLQQTATQQPVQTATPDTDGLTRVHFDEIFVIDSNGNLSPKVPVDINGAQMTPGVSFGGGVQFGGLALSQAVGHDFGVRRLDNGFVQLVKYYN
ncbi:hypothetical protein HDG40_005654 [Paraburkholderia sp. JPY158]|uniref:Lipoprotein n=1 Tax=Paraburkholderia atlantica TaxID=2654982 RepID=A0A7W8QBX6_PARAM|nr:hypothetical protein [Paraburkholderia atlantica]MBB5427475.1 hypothetical protein [Paraburkholderia atlantica]